MVSLSMPTLWLANIFKCLKSPTHDNISHMSTAFQTGWISCSKTGGLARGRSSQAKTLRAWRLVWQLRRVMTATLRFENTKLQKYCLMIGIAQIISFHHNDNFAVSDVFKLLNFVMATMRKTTTKMISSMTTALSKSE